MKTGVWIHLTYLFLLCMCIAEWFSTAFGTSERHLVLFLRTHLTSHYGNPPLTCCTGSGPHSLQLIQIGGEMSHFEGIYVTRCKDKPGCFLSVLTLWNLNTSKCSTEISVHSCNAQHFITCLHKVLTVLLPTLAMWGHECYI